MKFVYRNTCSRGFLTNFTFYFFAVIADVHFMYVFYDVTCHCLSHPPFICLFGLSWQSGNYCSCLTPGVTSPTTNEIIFQKKTHAQCLLASPDACLTSAPEYFNSLPPGILSNNPDPVDVIGESILHPVAKESFVDRLDKFILALLFLKFCFCL